MYQCNYTLEKAGEEPIAWVYDKECRLAADESTQLRWASRFGALRGVDTSDLAECIEARDELYGEWDRWI